MSTISWICSEILLKVSFKQKGTNIKPFAYDRFGSLLFTCTNRCKNTLKSGILQKKSGLYTFGKPKFLF